MDTREALEAELSNASEDIVKEAYDFVCFLKSRAPAREPVIHQDCPKPDFAALRRSIFGDRQLEDSQVILGEIRADRF